MQFVIFIAFTLLVGVVAYLATRSTDDHSDDGYFLGGRSLTGPVIGILAANQPIHGTARWATRTCIQ